MTELKTNNLVIKENNKIKFENSFEILKWCYEHPMEDLSYTTYDYGNINKKLRWNDEILEFEINIKENGWIVTGYLQQNYKTNCIFSLYGTLDRSFTKEEKQTTEQIVEDATLELKKRLKDIIPNIVKDITNDIVNETLSKINSEKE